MSIVLERIYIENYKCLVDFDLQLQETTLLLGANGSGKTAVLDVVYGIGRLLAGEVKVTDPVAFPLSTLTRWQSHRHQQFRLQVRAGSESLGYSLRVDHDPDIGSRVVREMLMGGDGTVLFDFNMGEVQLYRDDGSEGPRYRTDWTESALARVVEQPVNRRLTAFLNTVRDTVVCTIRPYGVRSESSRADRLLGRYADNFVAWYRDAVLESPGMARSHEEALQLVIDGFDSLHLKPVGADTRELRLRFANTNGSGNSTERYWLSFDELSDGQRALVVLYGLLHLRGGDGISMFLDEPDNYVALPEIQPWLLAMLELCEETPSQAVICSHHPEMIDYLGPHYGLILRRNASGATTARPVGQQASPGGLKLSELVARGWDM